MIGCTDFTYRQSLLLRRNLLKKLILRYGNSMNVIRIMKLMIGWLDGWMVVCEIKSR